MQEESGFGKLVSELVYQPTTCLFREDSRSSPLQPSKQESQLQHSNIPVKFDHKIKAQLFWYSAKPILSRPKLGSLVSMCEEATANSSACMLDRTKKIASLNENPYFLRSPSSSGQIFSCVTSNIHFSFNNKNVNWWYLIIFACRTLSCLAMYILRL